MCRKGNLCALLVGMQAGATPVEGSMEFPQKIKNGTAFWPSNSTFETTSKETQNPNLKERKHPCVHCSVTYTSQDLQPTCPSVDEWIKRKLWYIYTMTFYSALKKEGNLTLCDSMDGLREHSARWNKPVGERQVPYDFTYMWPK